MIITTRPDKFANEKTTLIVVCVVQFLTPFMMSAVGVALPAIGREFGASAFQLGLVETVYILAVSLLLLPMGRLGDIHGRKRLFTAGIGVFICATFCVALSWSVEAFILFRFFQGTGAAMIAGTSVAILSSVFPPEKRGCAMGIIVACVYLGLSAGPLLAGVMVTHMNWRWIFYFGLLAEVVAFLLTVFNLHGEWAEARGERFDRIGSMIYVIALFCFILGVLNKNSGNLYSGLTVLGFAGICLFLWYEYRTKSPILNVHLLLSNRVFAFSNIATLINYAASFGLTFFLSLYLQYVKGLTPQSTGIILVVQPVFQALLSPFFGRLSDRYSSAALATLGMGICALGLLLAASLDADSRQWIVFCLLAIMGVGFAVFSSPNMVTVMASVGPKHYGIASSLVATMRTIGMLASMTIITLIFSRYMKDQSVTPETLAPFLSSLHLAMLVFCGLCCLGILFSMGRTVGATKI